MQIDVTIAVEMGDHWNARFFHHPFNEAAPAARYDEIDKIRHPKHSPDRGAIPGRDRLYRAFRKAGLTETILETLRNRRG